jgi:Mg-chelatase subunit ChlI
MTIYQRVYPFTAIVAQEQLKLSLILNVVNRGSNRTTQILEPYRSLI